MIQINAAVFTGLETALSTYNDGADTVVNDQSKLDAAKAKADADLAALQATSATAIAAAQSKLDADAAAIVPDQQAVLDQVAAARAELDKIEASFGAPPPPPSGPPTE